MSYRIEQIAAIIGGKALIRQPNKVVTHLSIDSRRVIHPDSTLFFAISGTRNDGHLYIQSLKEEGLTCFVVQQIPKHLEDLPINFIVVPDTVKALQDLCAHHRKTFEYPVIGITGSNGKTIVKEWLYQVLNSKLRIVRNPKSYNSQVGVPLSVWQMNNTFDIGIFEAGISMPGEMEHLERILKPDIGLFVTLGDAHSEHFETLLEKGREKLKLFENTPVLLGRSDKSEIDYLFANWLSEHPDRTLITWSDTNRSADLYLQRDAANPQWVDARYKAEQFRYFIPFADEASFENAAIVMLTALYLGFEKDWIVKMLEHLQPVEMRLQKIEGINNTTLINDTYNSDINSLEISVDLLTRLNPEGKKTVILTDILQTEKASPELYQLVNAILRAKNVDRFIGIGPEMEAYAHLIEVTEKTIYPSTESFLSKFDLRQFRNESILLKGARNFGLEQIVKLLERQTHQTVFEINLSAIEQNYRYLKTFLPKTTAVMGMVKAYSYGSGSYEVARLLQDNGVDYLAVAYTDEGVALRQKGIFKPIMVMNPDYRAFETMIEYNLEPEIYSFDLLHKFAEASRSSAQSTGMHIEIDTGMHRLGFLPESIPQLKETLSRYPFLEVKSIFSHLAGSDEKRLDAFSRTQIHLFKSLADELVKGLKHKPLLHILNSAGVLHFAEGIFDMVRIGIGLHGIDPSGVGNKQLQAAGSLKSYISQIKTVKAGEGISYGLHSVSSEDRTIAIVAIGYADGLNRKLGNGNWEVLIQGKKCKTAGNICMDMFMADVTNVPCSEGDEVLIFGKQLPIELMAERAGTIAYELLTSVSQRVKRVYWYE